MLPYPTLRENLRFTGYPADNGKTVLTFATHDRIKNSFLWDGRPRPSLYIINRAGQEKAHPTRLSILQGWLIMFRLRLLLLRIW